MGEEKQEAPDAEGDKDDDEAAGRGLGWKSAWAPITGMVVLILITVSISLFVAPLYISQGMQAFGEKGATDPWIAVYYLVMIIVVTTIILLLRKFLKRRKRNLLKYVLAAAVLFSTYAVVSPVLDVVVNGMPEEWEVQELEVDDPYWALPISMDEEYPSMMIISNNTLSLLGYEGGEYEAFAEENQIDQVIPVAITDQTTQAGSAFVYQMAIRKGNEVQMIRLWDGSEGSGGYDITYSSEIFTLQDNISLLDATTIRNHSGRDLDLYLVTNGTQNDLYGHDMGNRSLLFQTEEDLTFSFGSETPLVHSNNEIYSISFDNGSLLLEPIHSMVGHIHWIRGFGESYLISTEQGLHLWEPEGELELVLDRVISSPSLVWLAEDESGWEITAMRGRYLYVVDEDDRATWELDDYNYLMIYEDSPGGTLTIVSGEKIERWSIPGERGGYLVEGGAFLFAFAVVGILLWKPKWWIVDLSGILMGAGVLTLIGISISILPILLLLVLLAVYDFISVYKTKHMLALAESVVEAKLPILLVFPLKWGYRYEDETNLLDKNRPREAMFMGLGDVIIPGSLLISAYTFLPSDGISLLGMISPQLSVAMFSLIGMLIALLFLMYQVLKGKAHAGLPFLNGGVILGFLLGELIIYGTIII